MFAVFTNTLDTKPSRNAGVMLSTSADCGLLAYRPITEPTQPMEKPNSSSTTKPATAEGRPFPARQPTASAQQIITASEGRPTMTVDTVRPTSTEDRVIGSALNRSITPSDMSVATATATEAEANSVDWANRPDIR